MDYFETQEGGKGPIRKVYRKNLSKRTMDKQATPPANKKKQSQFMKLFSSVGQHSKPCSSQHVDEESNLQHVNFETGIHICINNT